MSLPAAFLAVLSVLVPSLRGQALDFQPPDPWESVNEALIRLDQALLQQIDPELWSEVRDTAGLAVEAVARARDLGAARDVCQAALVTARTIIDRQAEMDAEAWGGERSEAELLASDARLSRMAESLTYAEGRLPQTTFLLVELLFSLEQDAEAAAAMARGLSLWPNQAMLHNQARDWSDVVPDAMALIHRLERRITLLDSADADYAGLALETVAQLHAARGHQTYATGEYLASAEHFAAEAAALHRSRSMPRSLATGTVANSRAQALVNAALSHFAQAQERFYDAGRDDADGMASVAAAEEALNEALELAPGHADATQAVFYIGDLLMNKGNVGKVRLVDQVQMRDFYGRMARRHDNADWWNNHAFWCRETGTSADLQGDTEKAEKLFEESYAAYERAVDLAPDNARYVNDTGLMLYYHLGREFDRAEGLFEKAWRLGQEVCDNPFVEETVYDENFSAFTDAMLNLARLYKDQDRLPEAKDVMVQLLELAPERLDVQMTRREIELKSAAAKES